MNLSDLSIEGLTQLEARLTSDLEMVKRVKALVMEYQKMGVPGGGGRAAVFPAGAVGVSGAGVPGTGSGTVAEPAVSSGSDTPLRLPEERLTEALAATSPDGFILEDLSRATYSRFGSIDKNQIKAWVKGMVRKGKVRVVEKRAGRIGSIYAVVRS